MRLEEICRLRVENLTTLDSIKLIAITPDEEWQGKTKAALRWVPIHPKLEELGLIDFAEQQQKTGKYRLFDELEKERDGYGARASKWFARYRKRCDIIGEGKVFHSFRELKQKWDSSGFDRGYYRP
jgi:hypothetical protein